MASDAKQNDSSISGEKVNSNAENGQGDRSPSVQVLSSARSAFERLLSRAEQPSKPLKVRESELTAELMGGVL